MRWNLHAPKTCQFRGLSRYVAVAKRRGEEGLTVDLGHDILMSTMVHSTDHLDALPKLILW